MNKINYDNIPKGFSRSQEKIIFAKIETSIKFFLIRFMEKKKNKSEEFRQIERVGFEIIVDNREYKVFKSYEWLRKTYYDNLKNNIQILDTSN